MNKNLKKVISSVAALALSASAVSAFAVDFPDVAADANYAQAVKELSALNVINGYEDGTFRPDELVTRAEITKMIVDALAETEQAEASKVNTKFADVSADHWAKGYINQGVADQFISGYSNTEFGPDDNVTYVQAQTMLVSAIGYRTYAEGNGGYPNGYKQWAASQGITDGISGLVDDTQLTRAQVAVLIDNAMGAPVCKIKSWKPEWNGTQTPELEIMDGEGKDYNTLFTEKHDAYKVYGRVTETSKTTSLDADKVRFRVEKADNFDDEYIKEEADMVEEDMYFGDTNADSMLRTYSQALIQKNDDDEYTIISIAPAAANKSVTVLSEDVDDSKTDLSKNVIYFFPAGQTRGSVKYTLADSVDFYVNGVKQDGSFDENYYNDYIKNNDTTTVTLQKETSLGTTSTSSDYNVIMVTSYTTAVVDQVVDRSNQTSINFKKYSEGSKASMKVQKDDDTKTYSFKTKDGEDVDPTTIEENTVLSISYDENAGFADSNFYDVIVSTDTVDAVKCTSSKPNANGELTFGGEKYKQSHGIDIASQVEPSSSYTLFLDAFGRIAYVDEDVTTKKLGVLKNVYKKNNGDYVAEVITKEGEEIEYKVKDENGDTYMGYIKDDANKSDRYPKQVIDYKVSSSNTLTINEVMEANGGADQTYKENSSKIGSIRISDSTVILDLTKVDSKDEYKVITKDDLKNDLDYTAYGYDKSQTDSTYRFVVITDGIGGVSSETQMAIFLEAGQDVEEDGDEIDTMTVVINGEQTTVTVDPDENINVDDYQEGDLILYAENAGYVTEVYPVFNKSGVLNTAEDYADFRSSAFDMDVLADTDFANLLSDDEEVDVVFGALVKNGNTTTVAPIASDANGYYIDFASENNVDIVTVEGTKVYTYNFDNGTKNFGRIVLDDGIMTTPDVTAAYEDGDKGNDKYYLDNEDVIESVVFAVVRTIDGDEAQEIYQIVAE